MLIFKMKPLPPSQVYEQELKFMPYKKSLKRVEETIVSQMPHNGSLLDLMSGPGYLLGRIARRRPDLSLRGVDLDQEYIRHAQERYPKISFSVGDVLNWKHKGSFDAVICTGALHHIPYRQQEKVVRRISSMILPGGFGIVSDCYVDDFSNETERQLAAAKLGYEYLRETIENGAPKKVIEATADILSNDILMAEFKTSIAKRTPIFKKYFQQVKTFRTWPTKSSGYGDYITILKPK